MPQAYFGAFVSGYKKVHASSQIRGIPQQQANVALHLKFHKREEEEDEEYCKCETGSPAIVDEVLIVFICFELTLLRL